MREKIEAGYQAFVSDGDAEFGAVRDVSRDELIVYVENAGDEWKQKRYRGGMSFVPFVELALGLYFTAMAVYAAAYGIYGTLPFILIFQAGFLYAAGLSLFQNMVRVPAWTSAESTS
jgi:hypothetical protein